MNQILLLHQIEHGILVLIIGFHHNLVQLIKLKFILLLLEHQILKHQAHKYLQRVLVITMSGSLITSLVFLTLLEQIYHLE